MDKSFAAYTLSSSLVPIGSRFAGWAVQRLQPALCFDQVQLQRPIDPVVTFKNSQGEAARGTLTSLQRRSLVLEIYNPYSIVQVSEVLTQLVIRSDQTELYRGKGIVDSVLDTGLMSIVSISLEDEWRGAGAGIVDVESVGMAARRFVDVWDSRPKLRPGYLAAVAEFGAFLRETAKWLDQLDMSASLPRQPDGRLASEFFQALAGPIFRKGKDYFGRLENEGAAVPVEESAAHRGYAQALLHPLVLRAPFVYRTFAKPLGYAGDYEMVNQIVSDPQQGSSTYFQLVNAFFLATDVAQAHRNRIDILTVLLKEEARRRTEDASYSEGENCKVLNVACGPAIEVRRFISETDGGKGLDFTLLDFSKPTLDYTRAEIERLVQHEQGASHVSYVHKSVHQLLKTSGSAKGISDEVQFDLVYCAGLFDYLVDKICRRLLTYFVQRTRPGGRIVVTNVHSCNPQKYVMEHVLEWRLIYRDEEAMRAILPPGAEAIKLYTDATGVNIFAEFRAPHPEAAANIPS